MLSRAKSFSVALVMIIYNVLLEMLVEEQLKQLCPKGHKDIAHPAYINWVSFF